MTAASQTAPLAEAVPDIASRVLTPVRTALFLTLSLRLFYCVVAAAVSPVLVLDPYRLHAAYTEGLIERGAHPLLYAIAGVWQRFDTILYIHIARNGYENWSSVFYPLYPALIRMCTLVTRSDLASALLVSTVATFFLFWGALVLLELDYTPRIAMRSLVLWMIWPDAFIFFAGYPDSLLLALTVWSIYFARKSKWGLAGTMALLAGLTKALGCFVALPLLYLGWKQRDRRSILAAIAAGVGMVAFQLWLRLAGFPPPLQIYAVNWHIGTVAPWITSIEAVRALAGHWDKVLFMNLAALAAAAVLSLHRRVPVEYRIYAAVALLLFLTRRTDPPFLGNARYALCLFGAFPTLANRLNDNFDFLGTAGFLAIVNLLLFREFLDWNLVV